MELEGVLGNGIAYLSASYLPKKLRLDDAVPERSARWVPMPVACPSPNLAAAQN